MSIIKNSYRFPALVLSTIAALSVTNFLPLFRLSDFPFFHVACVVVSSLALLGLLSGYRGVSQISRGPFTYYCFYLFASAVPAAAGIYSDTASILIFSYNLIVVGLFLFTVQRCDCKDFNIVLNWFSFAVLAITLLGWSIRLGVVATDFLFADVTEAEFYLGYWGLRYQESTRNADYLYPLTGYAISIWRLREGESRFQVVLFLFYASTLLATNSRAALLLALLGGTLVLRRAPALAPLMVTLLGGLVVALLAEVHLGFFSERLDMIFRSIFSTASMDSRFSNADRLQIIFRVLGQAPLSPLGLGVGNFSDVFERHGDVTTVSHSAENAYLTILLERGWVAFGFFALFVKSIFRGSRAKGNVSLNTTFAPLFFFYLLFNYELDNIFANFLFFILLAVDHFEKKQRTT